MWLDVLIHKGRQADLADVSEDAGALQCPALDMLWKFHTRQQALCESLLCFS